MIDNTSICNIYLLKFIVFDGVSKMYVLLRPKRGVREKELEKLDVKNMLVLNYLLRPFLKDKWAYWILQAWSILVLSYIIRPW